MTFTHRYRSPDFVHKKVLDRKHRKLHNIIVKLKSQGLGYRRISKRLNEMGIKSFTGKTFYPSLVSELYKKIEKKLSYLDEPTIYEYYGFDIYFMCMVKDK